MNKRDLIKKIVNCNKKLSIREIKMIVDCLIENISLALKKGDRITLKDFGAFYNSERKGKRYYDISTGNFKISSNKKTIKFIPYKNFKEYLFSKVLDTHIENDGSIGDRVKLERNVFNPPFIKENNVTNTKPLSGKENTGPRVVRKLDIEPTDLLFNGAFLFGCYCGKSEHKDFPVLRTPRKGTPILTPKFDKVGTTVGVMEPVFNKYLYKMCKEIKGIKVLENVKLPIFNRNYSYRPDFCLYWEKKKLYIDIEIDEPYDIVSRKPIHYLGNGDNLRDRYFIRNGWCVLRFAEQQIKDNTEGVINYVKRVLRWLTDESEIKIHDNTLDSINRWSYEEAMDMSSKNIREKYLGLSMKIKSEVMSNMDIPNEIQSVFIKPAEDILPDPPVQDECKWISVVEQLKQSNCEYCIVKRNNGYKWVYSCKSLKITSQDGLDLITGDSPLEIERKFPLDEIIEVTPLEKLFSDVHWECKPSMSLDDYKTLKQYLFDAIANGKPIWIAYNSSNSGYSTRFLSNIAYEWHLTYFNAPHIGLGHCMKHGIQHLSHFFGYCSKRKEFRQFAADGRIKELKILNCDNVYLYDYEYAYSFERLVMHPYENGNGNAFFENADEILRIMPKKEFKLMAVQCNLANLQVMKGEIDKAISTYQQNSYNFLICPSMTWGETCIADIKYFIELCKEHIKDNHFYEGLDANILMHRFEEVLIKLINSSWMQDRGNINQLGYINRTVSNP